MGIRLSGFESRSSHEGEICKYLKPVPEDEIDEFVKPYTCPICKLELFSSNERVLSDHVLKCVSEYQESTVIY